MKECERLPNDSWDNSNSEEKIDFAVSNDWLAHYHRIGMTPRKPIIEGGYNYALNEREQRFASGNNRET